MTCEEFNAFCRSLPAPTYVLQWGGSYVWKVGGKVFAIGGWGDEEASFTFRVSSAAYEMLKNCPAAGILFRVARPDADLTSRKAWPARQGVAGLYPPIAFDRHGARRSAGVTMISVRQLRITEAGREAIDDT
jgi:hypothetical protein